MNKDWSVSMFERNTYYLLTPDDKKYLVSNYHLKKVVLNRIIFMIKIFIRVTNDFIFMISI